MHVKGSQDATEVTNPQMDEEKIAQVSEQLNQIMESQP